MAKRKYCPNCKQKLTKGENHVVSVTYLSKGGLVYLCRSNRRDK